MPEHEKEYSPRRRFMGQLSAGLAMLTGFAGARLVGAQGVGHAPAGGGRMQHDSPHDAWMKGLTGHHRQIFHGVTANVMPGLMAKNFLDSYAEAYGAPREHVNAVVGVHGPALAIALSDAMWQKYGLGQRTGVTDPATQQPAERNIFAAGSDTSVETLQQRGVLFLVCNTALRLSSAQWAPSVSQSAEATYEELRAGVLPGMIVVPALVVAMNRAQEAGFTYVRAS